MKTIGDAIGYDGQHGPFWLEDVWDDVASAVRRELWPSPHDTTQDSRQTTVFDGDKLDSPPLAWILFWQYEFSNLSGIYIPGSLRRWAFVIWDATRLDSDARDAAEQAYYEAGYLVEDPREGTWDSNIADSEVW